MSAIFNYPKFHAETSAGVPLVGGLVYTYAPGTTTPKASYSDSGLTSANTNPVVLDANGDATIYLNGIYDIVLKTSAGVSVWTMSSMAGNAAAWSGYEVDALNTYGSGTSFTQATINSALTAIGTTNKTTLLLRPGTWVMSADADWSTYTNVMLKFAPGAVLQIATGKTLTLGGSIEAGDTQQIFSCVGTGTVVWGTMTPVVSTMWFGTTQAAMQSAATSCINTDITLYTPETVSYTITSQLSLRYVRNLDIQGSIVVNYAPGDGTPAVVIGDSSAHAHTTRMYLHSVRNTGGTVPTDPLIRVIGAKDLDIHIGICEYVQVYANADAAADASSAYNRFKFDYVYKHEILSEGTTTTGWINENRFEGGRIHDIVVSSVGYKHNGNTWKNPVLESTATAAATVTFNVGYSNVIENARFEGVLTPTITFAAGTFANVVTQLYTSILTAFPIAPTVTDNGHGNLYFRTQNIGRTQKEFFNISKYTRIHSDTPEIAGSAAVVQPGLEKLTVTASQSVWTSDFIPVQKGMLVRLVSDAQSWRHRLYVYDSTRTAITTAPTGQISVSGFTFNASGYYAVTSNVKAMGVAVLEPTTLAYIKIEVRSGATPDAFDALVGYYWPRVHDVDVVLDGLLKQKIRQISLAAAPTNGFATVGEIVTKTNGAAFYICNFALDTTLTEEVSISEKTDITCTSLTGVQAGDIVGILLNDGTTYWDTVADVVGGDLTLTGAGPTVAAANGNRIVFNRWTTLT